MENINNLSVEDLQEQYQELAEVIGIDSLITLSNYYGGTQLYVPLPDKLSKNVKYKAIIEEFDGFNIKSLSKKYGVSESTVYRLIRQQAGLKK